MCLLGTQNCGNIKYGNEKKKKNTQNNFEKQF